MELADMQDLGSCAPGRMGSSPIFRSLQREFELYWFRLRAVWREKGVPLHHLF